MYNDYELIHAFAQERMLRDAAPLESLDELRGLKEELKAERLESAKFEKQTRIISIVSLSVSVATLAATMFFGIMTLLH